MWIAALGILVLTAALEDLQEANADRGFLAGWWYAENRWRHKYRDWPTDKRRKWWALVGLGAFVDLWHLAKTIRLWLVCALIVAWAGLSYWWTPVAWAVYGIVHDHIFYGRLFDPRTEEERANDPRA